MVKTLKLGEDTVSLRNWVLSQTTKNPEAGMPATVLGWSDREAYFVESVSENSSTCVISRAIVKRLDNNGESENQEYSYEKDPHSKHLKYLRYRYNGWWAFDPAKNSWEKIKIVFGIAEEYFDYSSNHQLV